MEETLGCDVRVTHESRVTSNRPVLFVGAASLLTHEQRLRLTLRHESEHNVKHLPRPPLAQHLCKRMLPYEVAKQHQKKSSSTSALAQRTLIRRLRATTVASTNSKPGGHAYTSRVRILLHWPSRVGSRTKTCTGST